MPSTDDVTLGYHESDEAAGLLEQLCDVYADAYSAEQDGEKISAFLTRAFEALEHPHYELIVAQDSNQIISFVFGYTLPAGTSWWDGLTPAGPEGFTAEDGTRTFVLAEIEVRHPWQGKEGGRALNDAVLVRRSEERATFATGPNADTARAFYEHWGSEHEVERALVIVAHPDDAEFWAGGTIARWVDAGVAVTYCVLTDGETGGYDANVPREDIPHIRRAEQQKAATALGVKDVQFFGLAEGELQPGDINLRRELVALIRTVRPQRIITWSPEWNWQRFRSCHPDHRATGEIALSAVYPDAGNQFAHLSLREEGLEAWTVREAWLINSPHANHYVDITETFERKVAAVQLHKSQTGNRKDLTAELREQIAPNTAAAQLPVDRLAEAFQVVVTG